MLRWRLGCAASGGSSGISAPWAADPSTDPAAFSPHQTTRALICSRTLRRMPPCRVTRSPKSPSIRVVRQPLSWRPNARGCSAMAKPRSFGSPMENGWLRSADSGSSHFLSPKLSAAPPFAGPAPGQKRWTETMPRRPLPDREEREEKIDGRRATKVVYTLLAIVLILVLAYLFI